MLWPRQQNHTARLSPQAAANVGLGAVEEWTIINLTGDAHPIHMHEGLFEVRRNTALWVLI
jgi:FtsP/CotA-like multicopper oxidase with cupredoxin domain